MQPAGDEPERPARSRPWDGPPGFLALYDRTTTGIFRFLFSMTNDEGSARDLHQETFIRLLEPRHWCTVRMLHPKQQEVWLLHTAHNLFRDQWRHARRMRTEPLPEELSTTTPWSDRLDRRIDAESQAMKVLRRLPLEDRTVLFLRFVGDLEPAEISEVLGVPAKMVSKRLYRAKQRAQRLIAEPGKEGQR